MNLAKYKKIVLAGGCFWCLEPPYDEIPGIKETIVGYTGGEEVDPTYEEVAYGQTGHTEAIEITYDEKEISLDEILAIFWKNIDPLQKNGQFCDKGKQYRTGIFYKDDNEKTLANKTREKAHTEINEPGEFQTEITKLKKFYPAEEYHQEYYIKNPYRYKTYRFFCGRDQRLNQLWSKK